MSGGAGVSSWPHLEHIATARSVLGIVLLAVMAACAGVDSSVPMHDRSEADAQVANFPSPTALAKDVGQTSDA